jgi:predicted esterase
MRIPAATRAMSVVLLSGLLGCRAQEGAPRRDGQPLAELVVAAERADLPNPKSSVSVGSSNPAANASDGSPSAQTPKLPALTDAVWLESLPMPPGRAAVVSVPLGATEPRPVMIGMHGAGDRPEWACGGYRAATDAFPFIICPRGLPQDPSAPDKFASPGSHRIREDVASALRTLRERFGAHVADGPLLYAGFSLGANHGAQVIAAQASTFPIALLIEGGYSELTPALARAYADTGGKRVMLGCGQPSCRSNFVAAQRALERAGIEVLVLDAKTGRHNLDGPMMNALRDAWPKLVEGDPRWDGLVASR